MAILGSLVIVWSIGGPSPTSEGGIDLEGPGYASASLLAAATPGADSSARTDAPYEIRAPGVARLNADLDALGAVRPGFPFWRHIFLVPDGAVAFGSALDGRLLAVLPTGRDWSREGTWLDADLRAVVRGRRLSASESQRREEVAELMEARVGAVVHNATRGGFLRPNVERYGGFVEEWGRIYERFGVPAEVGLAQAIVESGLDGRIRSEAGAIGFCQWLEPNWNRLKRLSPHVIEGYNQTTQAPFCAAYLTVLATRYGSFLPALSEHHAGGTNVGRVVIAGGWLGGTDDRERYLLGSDLLRDLRQIPGSGYGEVVGTYGPRSYRYAEMVFGNMETVRQLRGQIPPRPIHAMRTDRAVSLGEVSRRSRLPPEELRRYNPSLVRQVPRGGTVYLPVQIDDLGADVAFWQRPTPPAFASLMGEFLDLEGPSEAWEDPAFARVLDDFRERFAATATEEGDVMAAVLGYFIEEAYSSRRSAILAEVRTSGRVRELFRNGLQQRDALRGS